MDLTHATILTWDVDSIHVLNVIPSLDNTDGDIGVFGESTLPRQP